jgi:hypothetical protein
MSEGAYTIAKLDDREVVRGYLDEKKVRDFTDNLFSGSYHGALLKDKISGEILGMHGKGSMRGSKVVHGILIYFSNIFSLL